MSRVSHSIASQLNRRLVRWTCRAIIHLWQLGTVHASVNKSRIEPDTLPWGGNRVHIPSTIMASLFRGNTRSFQATPLYAIVTVVGSLKTWYRVEVEVSCISTASLGIERVRADSVSWKISRPRSASIHLINLQNTQPGLLSFRYNNNMKLSCAKFKYI